MSAFNFAKKHTLSLIIFLLIFVLVVWLAWFGVPFMVMNEKKADNVLQTIKTNLESMNLGKDKRVEFSYGNIEIKGAGYGRMAVINNVNLGLFSTSSFSKASLIANTETIEISLDPLNYKRLIISFNKPLNIFHNGFPVTSVVYSEPVAGYYIETTADGEKTVRSDVIFPKQFALVPPKLDYSDKDNIKNLSSSAIFDKAMLASGYSVTFANSPTLQILSVPDKQKTTLSYDIAGFSLNSDGQAKIGINTISSRLEKEYGGMKNTTKGNYSLSIGDILFFHEGDVSSPYSLTVNTEFMIEKIEESFLEELDIDKSFMSDRDKVIMGLQPKEKITPDPRIEGDDSSEKITSKRPTENRDVTINEIAFSNPYFKIKMSGKFSNIIGDPLPSGAVNIEIENVSEFIKSEIVAMYDKENVINLLTAITGENLREKKNITIPLKREKMGIFYIGNTTFEHLITSFITGSMIPAPEKMLEEPTEAPNTIEPSIPPQTTPPQIPENQEIPTSTENSGKSDEQSVSIPENPFDLPSLGEDKTQAPSGEAPKTE